jgi:hypothetical protein
MNRINSVVDSDVFKIDGSKKFNAELVNIERQNKLENEKTNKKLKENFKLIKLFLYLAKKSIY